MQNKPVRSDQDYGTSWKEYEDMAQQDDDVDDNSTDSENLTQNEPVVEMPPNEYQEKKTPDVNFQNSNLNKGKVMSFGQNQKVKLNNNMYEKEIPNFDNLEQDYPEATVLEGNMSIQNMEIPGLLIIKNTANVRVKNNLKCHTLWLSGSLQGKVEAENICLFSQYASLEGIVKTKHVSYEFPDGEEYNTFTAQVLMKNQPN